MQEEQYRARFSGSAALFGRAQRLFPSGLTHDARYLEPFPVYAARAAGAHKWDVDGHELIDYWMGHGALLLGHAHPTLVEAVTAQVARGTHLGANHPLEVEWAELVQALMPAVERIRFTNSGTEATQLAMRLARAYTGRTRIVKFQGHFHGWHDTAAAGGAVRPAGIPEEVMEAALVVPPNEPRVLEEALRSHPDVAGVIIEPGGGAWGELPVRAQFLHDVRDLTERYGVVLIFDEVVTGFRMAPGGAQQYYGIRPDLVCLGKILCGGLPGGAVGGRAEIVDLLAFTGDPARDARKVAHLGTFNANPLSAAAGIAMLRQVQTGEPTRQAAQLNARLVAALNEVLERRRVKGFVYGLSSWFHVALGTEGERQADGSWWPLTTAGAGAELAAQGLVQRLRRAMLLEGVDLMRNGGFLSTAHTLADLEATAQAFDRALERMREDGGLPER
ncbi:aspartate aminotransferase family protein [Carboxydochorda subterranea]|uniref:Aspartate aminotransferase family protein n=1 Tax=Carboxydichorda subterranea TaxID=3109565 RepID=A0ABZ1BTZ5_9FIRM|nr:aspartate aminotransferase family protein [Limnochorda sp. L945t]WRP16302.1 aspartate aminotransferase family protein [Limnochorda sp. L945t]